MHAREDLQNQDMTHRITDLRVILFGEGLEQGADSAKKQPLLGIRGAQSGAVGSDCNKVLEFITHVCPLLRNTVRQVIHNLANETDGE